MSKKAKPTVELTPEQKYPELCVYAGRRLDKNNKLHQCFIFPGNEVAWFKGIKGVHLGYTYRCTKEKLSVKPPRVYDVSRVDNPEWEAADALVDAHNAKKRAAAKIAATTSPAIKNAIQALIPVCRNLGYYDRQQLIEFLTDKATVKPKQR